MSTTAAVAPASELNEVAQRLDAFAAGDVNALGLLRPTLHRIVVSPAYAADVKTLLVQAMLLLDDPRVSEGSSGAPLLSKIRKLVGAAVAARSEARQSTGPAISAAAAPAFSPDALLSPDADRALLDEFIVEAREQLETAEAALLVLDSDPDDRQALETIFRSVHSIKGTSAFLGIEHATELAHHAETLLTRVRAGAAVCTGDLANLIFRSIDMLDAILAAIEGVEDGEVAMVPTGYRDLLATLRAGPELARTSGGTRSSSGQFRRLLAGDLSVRIRVAELDRLAGAVHELVLAHEMLARDASLRGNPDLARKTAFAERLAFELEDLATELRTVSFGALLQRLARLARDAAYQSGKSVELVMEGDDVLVERVMADAIADPLMHMVRNAIDHGFETAGERSAAGKQPAGRLRISAQRMGAQLIIELSDDGRGIDPRRLERVAKERGLISPDSALSDDEAFALLFRPGFTTATVVTDLSGRGVGMDVVRTNLDTIGGTIDVDSRLGEGTTFTIRLPFRTQSARTAQPNWVDTQRSIGLIA